MTPPKYRHLNLESPPRSIPYTTPNSGGPDRKKHQPKERESHARKLAEKFESSWKQAEKAQAQVHSAREGIYLEFKGAKNAELATQSLEDLNSKKIRLLNTRTQDEETYATVYIANQKRQSFLKKIQEYSTKDTPKGAPKHQPLMESIEDISQAVLKSFWQDPLDTLPDIEPQWCEVWLSSEKPSVKETFTALLEQKNIEYKPNVIVFPERTVLLICANQAQLASLLLLSDHIAELRLGRHASAGFWLDFNNASEQAEWASEFLEQLKINPETQTVVCILDNGVNQGHPLLEPVLAPEDCQSVLPEWGVHDHHRHGHGTAMAGIAAYGDLTEHLEQGGPVAQSHHLESVKLMPPTQDNPVELWGERTQQAAFLAELQSPDRQRIFCMAISSTDTLKRGQPTSWSGAIDALSSGTEDGYRRLVLLAAGNSNLTQASQYPDALMSAEVHDPAQSWNALSVGAYTELIHIDNPSLSDFQPIAPRGCLSPTTSTSVVFEDQWPYKPEILLEGGNLAYNSLGDVTELEDLSLLSLSHRFTQEGPFCLFSMTSAATAMAAHYAAKIQSFYPHFWPETIRALLVHSAVWPQPLKDRFLQNESKGAYKQLMRIAGYGVPQLERALYSAGNSLTLIAQREILPFGKNETGQVVTHEMHIYELPWPEEVLLALPPETEIEMRVTLSYFIEPGPGELGWKNRYRYPSHLLGFKLNSPGEDQATFLKRVNKKNRADKNDKPMTQSPSEKWVIGQDARDKGSIHSDIWRGSAADLATSNLIAVYPKIGWWKTRSHLGKWASQTRYALIVSINSPEETIDLYTPVHIKLKATLPIEIHT